MQDRPSYSYRAKDLPGSNPDMYSLGGKTREAFREARASPYIREHAAGQSVGSTGSGEGDNRKVFKTKRQQQAPALTPTRGPSP